MIQIVFSISSLLSLVSPIHGNTIEKSSDQGSQVKVENLTESLYLCCMLMPNETLIYFHINETFTFYG